MNEKIICLLALIIVLILNVTNVFGSTFSDISGHWAEKVVLEMAEKGIINGFEDGTFRPNESVTREQFAKILVETLDIEERNTSIIFQDIGEGRWSEDYIRRACNYLIIGSTNDGGRYFMPEEKAIREEVATAVVKASGLENETPNYDLLKQFSDESEISKDLKKYIAIAVENGIMQGKGGYFDPKGSLTRAEVSQLVFNVFDKKEDEEVEISGDETIINNVEKNEEEFPYGDINGDGKVNGNDRRTIINHVKGKKKLEEDKIKNADVDLDGKITENDAWLIFVIENGEKIKLPHNCTSHTEEYLRINREKHKRIGNCECGEISYEITEKHEFEDEKCICGAEENAGEKIPYGDINSDKKIDSEDIDILNKFLSGENESIELFVADVDLDGKTTENDVWLMSNYVSGNLKELPHNCSSRIEKYVKVDKEKHKRIESCKCGKVSCQTTEIHEFVNGKCVCGTKES